MRRALALFFALVACECAVRRKYGVVSDTFVHRSGPFSSASEGGNSDVFVDKNKVALFSFDLDMEFRSFELVSAELVLPIHKVLGDGKLRVCAFLGDFVEGSRAEYYDPVVGGAEGASFESNAGDDWEFESMLASAPYEAVKVRNFQTGELVVDAKTILKSVMERDQYLTAGVVTLALFSPNGGDFLASFFSKDSGVSSAELRVGTAGRAELFEAGGIAEFRFDMAPADLAFLDSSPTDEEYAPCNVTYDGFRYTHAGCRYKGGVATLNSCCVQNPDGTFGPFDPSRCRKLSFKTDIYEFRSEMKDVYPKPERKRRIFNQKKLNFLGLEAAVKDIPLSEEGADPWVQGYDQVAAHVAIALAGVSGVDMALGRYARLWMNGEYMGLYLMVGQTDDVFTESRYFYDDNGGEGQLWKEIGFNNPTEDYFLERLEEGDEDMEWIASVVSGIAAAEESGSAREYMLQNFDVSSFLRLLAFNDIVGNYDTFAYMKCAKPYFLGNCTYPEFKLSNMYAYRYARGGQSRMRIVSHDLDGTGSGYYVLRVRPWYDASFDPSDCAHGEFGFDHGLVGLYNLPALCSPFFRILREHFMEEYRDVFYDLVGNVITEDSIDGCIDEAVGIIGEFVEDEPRGIPTRAEWEQSVSNFRQRMKALRHQAMDRMAAL